MESPAATMTAGIYCKTCGYDLRASGEAGRCPECGRGFSPDDPKSFRRRPFAAPWQRALERWAKRAAILLLALAVLLAGVWGWLYRGWKEEQAVLAETGGAQALEPVILGGAPGAWLHDRHIPGSFILERVGDVVLPPDATAASLLPLRRLPQLERLVLESPIPDAGFVHLEKLPGLKALDLTGIPVTDAALVHLEKLTELTYLGLAGTRITDGGLVHLAPLRKLRALNLQNTRITDAGLVPLGRLTRLESLFLWGTQVTPAGAGRLRAALPGCRIAAP